jgi:hypothetical protein
VLVHFKTCRFDLAHDFMYPSRSIVQENIISDHANDRFYLEVLTLMEDLPLTLGYEKVFFHSEHPLELLDKEDRVMKHDTSRVIKHNLILQGDMSPTHRRKGCMRGQEVFLLPTVPISFFSSIKTSFIVSCASPLLS